MAATEEEMREAYRAWLNHVEASGRTPRIETYLLWEKYDDNLPYRLGTPHLINLLDQAVERSEAEHDMLNQVRIILQSGYGCVSCAVEDLRQAVGLEPITMDHEEHL